MIRRGAVSDEGVLFRSVNRDCLLSREDAALLLDELKRVSFEETDSATSAARAIERGLETGEVNKLAHNEVAAVQAVLLRFATSRPEAESLTTLHDALALDYGEPD